MSEQPSLFEPAKHTWEIARDKAMQQVGQAAEETRPDFAEDARAFVLGYLRDHGPTSGEVLSAACKNAGITPHDDRAFGPVYFHLAKAGRIVKVGQCRRVHGHGTSGGNVWGLA